MSQTAKNDTANDKAWVELFEQYRILDEISNSGIFRISASQINQVREARLMTKFDHKADLPKIFRNNQLSILPDSRGTYVIGCFDAYHRISTETLVQPLEFPFPYHIETIDYANLYSEVSALLCAYNTGIIENVVEEDVRLTVFGRMSTSKFHYQVRNLLNGNWYSINVDNSQCEIDGGFEGETKFAIIEAKNYTADDFLIRQLYYPYRLWRGKTSKEVIPIFMSYSNDIFTFYVYKFLDDSCYNSIELIAQKHYQIAPESITLDDIYTVFQTTKIRPDLLTVPFPQADKFTRVIDLLGFLYATDLAQQEITQTYQFAQRQTQYYTNSAIYLDLIQKTGDKNTPSYSLTPLGRAILEKKPKGKYLAIVGQILQHEVFYKALAQYFSKSERPSRTEIIHIMQSAKLNLGEGSTIPRRAQTVLAWIDWILGLLRVT